MQNLIPSWQQQSPANRRPPSDDSLGRARALYETAYALRRRHFSVECERTEAGIWVPSHFDDLVGLFGRLRGTSFLDLGAGDGIVLAVAAHFFPIAHGIELSAPWCALARRMMSELALPNVKVMEGNYLAHPFPGYDVVFISPDSDFSPELEAKLCRELTGCLVVYCPIYRPRWLLPVAAYTGGLKPAFIYRRP